MLKLSRVRLSTASAMPLSAEAVMDIAAVALEMSQSLAESFGIAGAASP